MGTIRSIAVLLHRRHPAADHERYRIGVLARIWRERGLRVDFIRGPARFIDADLLIPHVDLSIIPDDYWSVIQSHPRVVNRRVRDITKRSFSTHLVRVGDGYEGPVIVKSDLNAYGRPELQHFGAEAVGVPRFASGSYPLFASARDVPAATFEDRALVVQRFLPELENGRYVTRTWNFFGSGSRHVKWLSESPIVKGPKSERAEGAAPPDAIVEARRRLGLDYAKLDFVVHGGEAILLDVNRTPAVFAPESAGARERTLELADGLASFEDARY